MPTPRSLTYHQVDAFTDRPFAGNPAAVYRLAAWLDDATLAAIAAEHNLSETAFVVPESAGRAHLRWFTPTVEVELCGHATLATAHVLLRELGEYQGPLVFSTERAGELIVRADADRLWLDLPARPAHPCDTPPSGVADALGATPAQWHVANNLLAVFDRPDDVAALAPDMAALAGALAADDLGLIATAPAATGADHDFVSRYFAPEHGVPEDPVTGSAHCTLAPYWAARLGRDRLEARQISARGGRLSCVVDNARVHVGGTAVTVARGTLFLPEENRG